MAPPPSWVRTTSDKGHAKEGLRASLLPRSTAGRCSRGARVGSRKRPADLIDIAYRPRRVRDAERLRIANGDLLDHRLLQERTFGGSGPASEAWIADLLDVEGWHPDDAGAVADRRVLWQRRNVADVVRGDLIHQPAFGYAPESVWSRASSSRARRRTASRSPSRRPRIRSRSTVVRTPFETPSTSASGSNRTASARRAARS